MLLPFPYNSEGIRTSKTVNGIKHEYILDGSCIVVEKWVENNVEYMMVFLYDDAGNASVETYMIRAAEGVTFGAIGATLGGAGTATKHVSNHFWRMVKSGGKNMSYYFSQINCQAVRDGLKAIPGILKAAIPSASKTFIKSSVSKWR